MIQESESPTQPVPLPALPGRQDLTGRDWGFLATSLIVFEAGAGLAFRFRPRDTVGELRRRLAASPPWLIARVRRVRQRGNDDGHCPGAVVG